MAEELKKYKDILAREQKEFREEMEREVSAFLPFQLVKEKVGSEMGVTVNFAPNFVIFLFWILWSALSKMVFGYYSRGWIQDWAVMRWH